MIKKLKEKWIKESISNFHPTDIDSIQTFQREKSVIFPDDLKEYFKTLNGTGEEYTDGLYEFYSIERIKKVSEEFQDYEGVPKYNLLINIDEVKDLFVFANYMFNLFAYAIKIDNKKNNNNEVYILCGGEYKKIGNTFSEFLDLYLSDSIELYFNKEDS